MSEKNDKELYLNFDEYICQGEPSQREAAYAWSTAIGLQAVDGLKTSEYLNDLARRNIEGEISIDEVELLLNGRSLGRRENPTEAKQRNQICWDDVTYEQGKIGYEEKRNHVHRNIIMPVLGNTTAQPNIDVNAIREPLEHGDVFLICSDGLSDYIVKSEIEEVLSMPMPMMKRLEEMVKRSLNKGCRDNISVVAVTYMP